MIRAAVFGEAFDDAVSALGLERAAERADVVLVDLADPRAVAGAVQVPLDVPRVVVGPPEHAALLRAAGCAVAMAPAAVPAAIGPLIAAAIPPARRGATRLAVVTSGRGGVGRTLLAANLAARLAERMNVLVVDVTGSGAVAWWLGAEAPPWSDLESLATELTPEHLGVVSVESGGVRVLGGAPVMPSLALVSAISRVATATAELVIVDAPLVQDERTRALTSIADRVLLIADDDPSAAGALTGVADARTWLIASRGGPDRHDGLDVFRTLPEDRGAIVAARRGPSKVGGRLGDAYDDLAELLAIDAS